MNGKYMNRRIKNNMRSMPVFILCFLCISCLFGSHQVTESPIDKRFITYEMKDKGHVVIKYDRLSRTYSFTGIMSSGVWPYLYTLLTVTVANPSGRERTYRWIGVEDGRNRSINGMIIGSLAITDKDAYMGGTNNYKKYKGTGPAKFDKGDPHYYAYLKTYKWPVRYIWEDVSKGEFDRAAEKGDLISFQFTSSAGSPDNYSEKKIDINASLRSKPAGQSYFLESVKKGNAEVVADLLRKDPGLIHLHDDNGKTALHLALESSNKPNMLSLSMLDKFRPLINVIDFRGRTPLHAASLIRSEKAITDQLIRMGGKILYEDCESEKFGARNKILTKDSLQYNNPNGWLSNDVYQLWVESIDNLNPTHGALANARQRINLDLGLNGAPGSDLSRKIGFILENAHIACRGLDAATKKVTYYLVRICAPGLRDSVKDYNKQKR